MLKIQTITSIRAQIAEGPFWHNGAIYWVDVLGKKIHRYFPEKEITEEMQLDQYVGAIVPKEKEGFILALQNGFYFLDKFNGNLKFLKNPEVEKVNNRFNDGKCDITGRFWAGTMAIDESPNKGALYVLERNYNIYKKYSPVTISNGICWSLDNKNMYYIDTPMHQVLKFEFNLKTGEIQNPNPIIIIDKKEGNPDGMTIDTDGNLWIALWGGGAVVCYNPKTSKLLNRIELPVSQISSCAFGGLKLDDLYITSAKVGLDQKRLEKEPLAGSLFRVSVKSRGLPTNLFRPLP